MFNTKTQKVAFNTLFQFAGKIVTTFLSLLVIAYLTRYLGVSSYGEYTIIFAYVSFMAVIADFGFYWILVREIAKNENNISKIFNNIISLKIVFSVVVFLVGALIAFLIPQYSLSLKIGISIISFGWFWMSLNSTYVGLFQNKLEMYKSVVSDVIGRIIITFGVWYLVRLNLGLNSILWVYILGNFVNLVVSYLYGRQHIEFKFTYDWSFWKVVLIESMPLAILTFIGTINFKIDTIILSIMKGQVDVGIYGVPFKILEIIIIIPAIFVGNIFPILTKYFHEKDKRFSDAVQRSFDFLILIGLPVVAGLSILAKPIIKIIAGESYLTFSTLSVFGKSITAPDVLVILSISIGISFIITMFSNLVIVAGKQNKQVIPMIVTTLINVVLNIILIPKYSYLAASGINIISSIILLIWWNSFAHKYVSFKLHYVVFYKSLAATLIMSAVLYFLKDISLFLTIPVGIAVYSVASCLFKSVSKDIILNILPKSISNLPEDL